MVLANECINNISIDENAESQHSSSSSRIPWHSLVLRESVQLIFCRISEARWGLEYSNCIIKSGSRNQRLITKGKLHHQRISVRFGVAFPECTAIDPDRTRTRCGDPGLALDFLLQRPQQQRKGSNSLLLRTLPMPALT